jgi:hypothetical protein
MSRDLGARLDAAAVVSPGGTYALDNGLRFDSSALLQGRMFDTGGGATHVILLRSHPLIGLTRDASVRRALPGAVRLASYELSGGFVYDLYRVAAPAGTAPDLLLP